jgi:hypothetical protein
MDDITISSTVLNLMLQGEKNGSLFQGEGRERKKTEGFAKWPMYK